MARRPIALTIAGSDSGGGAGIQADLKTFSAFGLYGASAITALTAQNTRGVMSVMTVEPHFVTAQIEAVLSDLDVRAIKTGMLATASIVEAVAEALTHHPTIPVVADPVMVATSGDALLEPDAVAAIVRHILPHATLITPNLHEAAHLLRPNETIAHDTAAMIVQGQALLGLGAKAVLMKGGHGTGSEARDVLVSVSGVEVFSSPRLDTPNTHGTGCTLSAAIAAGLAQGKSLSAAVRAAKDYVTGALSAGRDLGVGEGRGPVDHLWGFVTS